MTLSGLILRIAIAAIVLTALTFFLNKRKPEWADVKQWWMTYIQHFCGALFVFSGYVKAIDPLGTAYKMEQYFAEFEATFAETALSFIAPMFPFLSSYSVGFSVFMIVLEIVLGVMLIIGFKRFLTASLFFIIILFFTFLTGFTYLTGYVPEGVNFFSFGEWGGYLKTNMKVTDCGCFGDFLKLEPKVSFLKDVFLMAPAILFLLFSKKKHVLFNGPIRFGTTALTTVGILVFCLSNYVWDLPIKDFRPFKENTNVRQVRADEEKRQGEAAVFYVLKDKENDNKEVTMPMNDYLAALKDPVLKTRYEFVDQIVEEVETSKITDFSVSDNNGNDVSMDIINYEGVQFMIVAHKLKYESQDQRVMVKDTIWAMDTIQVSDDSMRLERVVESVNDKEVVITKYDWNPDYIEKYTAKLNEVAKKAEAAGALTYGITKPYDPNMIEEFRHEAQTPYPLFTADDILLKTMVRSNPGVIIWKDGVILKKWHISKLPDFDQIEQYLK